eukprot:3328638-Pleurochrysis_carterae.AAC.1
MRTAATANERGRSTLHTHTRMRPLFRIHFPTHIHMHSRAPTQLPRIGELVNSRADGVPAAPDLVPSLSTASVPSHQHAPRRTKVELA